MHLPTHLLMSWAVANVPRLERRDRAIVTLAGISPDLDGLGIVAEIATRDGEAPLMWFASYHHVLCHNLGFALAVCVAALALAKRRVVTALAALAVFHLHLVCDVLGARGPDGSQWPVPYLEPFSDAWQFAWSGQWRLDAWPNMAITVALIAATFYLAWRRGFSPVEIVSTRADAAFVRTLRARFGEPAGALAGGPRDAPGRPAPPVAAPLPPEDAGRKEG